MRDAATIDQPSAVGPGAGLQGSRAGRTPIGLQKRSTLARRRVLVATLGLGLFAVLMWGVAEVLGAGGWTVVDVLLAAMIALSAPWTILGFLNAMIGLALVRLARDPVAAVAPFWRRLDAGAPLRARTAVLLTLRNEEPGRAFARAVALRRELDDAPDGRLFDLFVLSDTDDPAVAAREELLFGANRAALDGAGRAVYRRRETNDRFKAGNVEDFVDRWGGSYDFMLPLDADSAMSARAVRRLVRVMERHPRLGILQSLVVGAPAVSAFGRLFQFGMRHGMRSFTLGSAWWQGDCGPYWGHNALIRVAPFDAHCRLPELPGRPPLGGPILSHDQLEAVLMRRAGYEVRVAPVEGESWEENPVHLLEFIKRERRWLNGNMQYLRLLGMPGLKPVSRFQLVQAVMMYLAPAAWMAMTALAAVKTLESDIVYFNAPLAAGLFFAMLGMSLAPKAVGLLEVALRPGAVRSYGGPARFAAGAASETVFSALMAPAVAFSLTTYLGGLLAGRRLGGEAWAAQARDAEGLAWSRAAAALWPPTLFGAAIAAALAVGAPNALPWAAPVLVGLLCSIPIAVWTASPGLSCWMAAQGLAATPEETTSPATLKAVADARLAAA